MTSLTRESILEMPTGPRRLLKIAWWVFFFGSALFAHTPWGGPLQRLAGVLYRP